MKFSKLLTLIISVSLITSLFTGCGQKPDDERIVEVAPDTSGFPSVFIDDKDDFIFDYRVTGAKVVDEIKDETFDKQLTPEGKFLVIEFTAINRSHIEQFGNSPEFKVEYNGKTFDAKDNASVAEEDNIGLKGYATEKIKSARKGKYVKVYDLTNYDESVQNFKFIIDGEALGEIEVDLAKMNEGKLM